MRDIREWKKITGSSWASDSSTILDYIDDLRRAIEELQAKAEPTVENQPDPPRVARVLTDKEIQDKSDSLEVRDNTWTGQDVVDLVRWTISESCLPRYRR